MDSINWKRELHATNGTICIETFHYEFLENTLQTGLQERLEEHNVVISDIPSAELIEFLKEFGEKIKLDKLIGDIIKAIRAKGYQHSTLKDLYSGFKENPVVKIGIRMADPILKRYEQHLFSNKEIDFDTMISESRISLNNRAIKSKGIIERYNF